MIHILYTNVYITIEKSNQGIYDPGLGRYNNFNEEIVVPIIENTCWESELEGSLHEAMLKYPNTSAVLVRRHGIYVSSDSIACSAGCHAWRK